MNFSMSRYSGSILYSYCRSGTLAANQSAKGRASYNSGFQTGQLPAPESACIQYYQAYNDIQGADLISDCGR